MANKTKFGKNYQTKTKTSKPGKTKWMGRAAHDVFGTDTQSVGKYAQKGNYNKKGYMQGNQVKPSSAQAYKLEKMVQKRISKGSMSAKQRYKLEKEAVRNERMKINSKPEVIKAVGQSIAMNTAGPSAGYAASAAATNVNKLTSGGANVTTIGDVAPTSKEETDEITYTSQDYEVR